MIIATHQLTKRYGRRRGVSAIDLELREGNLFGFLGPNGAGKTTTIRLMTGFLRPSSGSASIFGLDCWRRSHRIKRDLGYLPGDLRLYPWYTGDAALRIAGRLHRRDLTAAGRALAERFRLDLSVRVDAMSRGMRQKLGLLLALAHDPRLLILDEPTSGLDPLMRDELASCLRERASRGLTVFFSSHTLSEVEQLCHRVAIVRDGRIVADERIDALRRRARRTVDITWRDAATADAVTPPEFLEVIERADDRWRCTLAGESAALVQWVAGRGIRDLTISPPDLETLFRAYYTRAEEEVSGR